MIWFTLMAWGYRGEPKPAWMDVAAVLATPGHLTRLVLWVLPPPIPELVPGAILGGLLALMVASWLDP